ncbi:MAG: hypothetical protein COA97_00765 [Flavobacteriales bacterium]|nr:MAG: hypothetical protein COA97_00765 [Flavobacteriales bacterium]
MSGLFLNFYQVEIPTTEISVGYKDYSSYPTKEDFLSLKEKYPNCFFYRLDDKILLWNMAEESIEDLEQTTIDLAENTKVLSKFIENSIVDYCKLKGYNVFKRKYAHTWEIKSPKDILQNTIEGLKVNRVIDFSTYFFHKDNKLLIGFTLSTHLKSKFTWDKSSFVNNGIDIKGLKGNEEEIFANTQSIKRFLESKGVSSLYESKIKSEKTNSKSFQVIDGFYSWLNKNKDEISFPFDLKISSISKRYLPFEDGLIKSEIIGKPQRYFYSNRKNTQGLKYYDQMVKTYQPYTLEQFQNKDLNIGVICPQDYQGETEGFIKKTEAKLKEVFHFNSLHFILKTIKGRELDDYKEVLYDTELQSCKLIYVIVDQAQEKLPPNLSPYYVCKAKLIGNGIPTQDVQIETIRQNLNAFTMTNIALNSYAKLGGTAWTIEKEEKLRDELVIGIGSTVTENGEHVLGIAQVFHNDGRYMTGDCSPLSTFENYAKNLEEHLYKVLKPLLEQMNAKGTFRLIFHLYKSASDKYEIEAINNLQQRLSEYTFEFALVHLGYGHNFRLYYNDGQYGTQQGSYVQLSKNTALLHFVNKSDLPLKIDIDKRSTFTSLFYIAKQIYWFSHLSHRSYIPSKRTVTIMYPSLMAKMTEELKKVDGWDYERLDAVSEKLWFI